MTLPAFLLASLSLLLAAGCGSSPSASDTTGASDPSSAGGSPVACPSIIRWPQLYLALAPALSRNERLELSVTVDGQHEDCALTITGIAPARDLGGVVESPSTRTDMTCELIDVMGIATDGSIPGFTLRGTPAAVEVHISRADLEVAAGTYTPTYAPTEVDGPGCGTTPRAQDTLRFR